MIYIDIDGVLADTDDFIFSKDPRAKEDTHILFKTIYKNYKEMFTASKPLIDLTCLKEIENFTLLTALPLRQKIDSFCHDNKELETIMNTLYKNKEIWIKNNIGEDCKYIIVGKRSDKIKMCNSSSDVLIDDSISTCAAWRKKGGKAYTSIQEFLENKNSVNNSSTTDFDKESLW